MATVIRLARFGAKKRPYYHIVVTDSRNARNSGNVLEVIGKYNPMLPKTDEKRVVLKVEELKAWLAKGAKPSDRVYKFMVNAGLATAKPIPTQTKKNLPSEKTQQKTKDKAEKLFADLKIPVFFRRTDLYAGFEDWFPTNFKQTNSNTRSDS